MTGRLAEPGQDPAITPVAEDYLKAIWSAPEWGGPPATVSSLATRFGTTRATVSATLARLSERGLVRHERYKAIDLSVSGRRLAVDMVRRHRLIETYLVQTLGYAWDEVHDEAERLEHAVSDSFIERIDVLLGHPRADPHGDPIPSAGGETAYPPDAVMLRDAGDGRYRVVRVSDSSPETLHAAVRHGLTPGASLTLDPVSRRALTRALKDPSAVVLVPAAGSS